MSDRSCNRGMIHNKIHFSSPGCPRPSIALQMQNRDLKHHSFHLLQSEYTIVNVSYVIRIEGFVACMVACFTHIFLSLALAVPA